MDKKTTLFYLFAVGSLLIASFTVHAQTEGDYRSNTAPYGLWSNPASWETYSGGTWIAASAAPTSAATLVTISSGDSIVVNEAVTIGVLKVETGAVLGIYDLIAPITPFTATLDGSIDVDGTLYVSTNSTTVAGDGNINISNTGKFYFRLTAKLYVNVTNAGHAILNTGVIENATFTNNGLVQVLGGTLSMGNNSTFLNNDSIAFTATSGATVIEVISATVNRNFINSSTGILFKQNAAGTVTFNNGVNITNHGTIKGFGEFNFTTLSPGANDGIIAPGNSPGILTVNSTFLTGQNATLQLDIASTGAVAGVNYDQIIVKNVPNTNIANLKLTVTDNSDDPVGTIYTLITTNNNQLLNTIQPENIILPPTLFNLTVTTTAVTVEKTTVLPVTWGYFFATTENESVKLDWETVQENNVKSFEVEYSSDNKTFSYIGTVAATNTNRPAFYSFTHTPKAKEVHLYRIKQIDFDGKYTYSLTKTVNANAAASSIVQISPNPVVNSMTIRTVDNKVDITIYTINGKLVRKLTLGKGSHVVSLSDLSSGAYIIKITNENKNSYQQKFIKN